MTPAVPDHDAPQPRRTRRGDIVIGPSVLSRLRPGLIWGVPLLALLLGAFASGVMRRRWEQIDQLPELLIWVLGVVVMGMVIALVAAVALILTHPTVVFDQSAGTLRRRRGLIRRGPTRQLADLQYAAGEAERSSFGLLGFAQTEKHPAEQWVIPHLGWDDASFDGLRVLQAAARYPVAPPRPVAARAALAARVEHTDRELAARYEMPWKPEYADHDRFLADFDERRRELGGIRR